ncbi:MAG: O-antigen ligase family protein [Candidatus Omnitrophica bacterium]|nr:O-antigen ligase family protein [Candidatus Omnitrophota bacterium]MDD5652725.1 O-antigen ligase family protein [Candidatus Omnitrophota bacterium]
MTLRKTGLISICDKISLYSLLGIAFFIPISKAIIEVFIYFAIVSFIVKKFLQREDFVKTPLNLSIFFYFFFCFVSIFISTNYGISSRSFLGKVLQNIALFFVASETLCSEKRLKSFIAVLSLSALVLGTDGIYQYFTHKDFIRQRPDLMIPRIYATFTSPSDFGCYLTIVIPFALAQIFVKTHKKALKLLFFGLFVLSFTCLVLTVSRGAWFAFIGSILFMSIWIHSLAVFFLVLGVVLIVLQPSLNYYIKERLNNFFVFCDPSSIDRKYMWEAGWKMFLSRPILGLGLGTFMFNFKKFVNPGFAYISYAHNCYLQMLAEIGIIGSIAFLSILASFFFFGIKELFKKKLSFTWYTLLAAQAAILGYCIQMVVDTSFYSLDLGVLFWLILGLGTAALKTAKS